MQPTPPGLEIQIPQRPQELPKWRRQVATYLSDHGTALRRGFEDQPETDRELDRLALLVQVADLYWATPEMSALAVASSAQLSDVDWAKDARPAAAGLIVFADGIGNVDGIPVDAMTWGPSEKGLRIWCWVHRRRIEVNLHGTGVQLLEVLPPLIPTIGEDVEAGHMEVADLPEVLRTPMATLAAAWLLMQQPTLASTSAERPPKPQRKAAARRGEELPDVTMIDLRRRYVPDNEAEPGDSGRTYRYRWVVSGHWRDQAHGPGRASRKRIWIPSYEKGPADAPLLLTEKVNVWRR